MAEFTGQQVGRYHIIEQLDEGGMAVVYKAYDTHLERDVAIKFIRRSQVGTDYLDKMLVRFEREAKRMAKFNHPNIVPIIDYGEHEGNPYLVMPFFAAGALKASMSKPMPYQEAARIVLPIAHALQYSHEHDTIHRDVKPANILMTEKGQPMLTDFGVAKILDLDEGQTLTGTGVGVGTPKYMAPEQWKNQVTPQTDVYALGVVFYELVTGHVPYNAETPAGVLEKQLTEPLTRPSKYIPGLPDTVEKILYKALAKKPQDRYADMNTFAFALEKAAYQSVEQPPISNHETVTYAADMKTAPVITTPLPKPIPASSVGSAEPQARQMPQAIMPEAKRDRSKLWLGLGAVGIVLLIIIIWVFFPRPLGNPTAAISTTTITAESSIPASIAPTETYAISSKSEATITSIPISETPPAEDAATQTGAVLPSQTPYLETSPTAQPTEIAETNIPKGAPTPDKALLKLPQFALKTPKDGTAFETKGKMEFSWESFPGAVSYRLEIIPANSKNVIRFTTREASKTQFSETFNWGGLFTWQVVALDQDEQPSAYSGQSYFSKPSMSGEWRDTCGGVTTGFRDLDRCQKNCDGYLRNYICEKE